MRYAFASLMGTLVLGALMMLPGCGGQSAFAPPAATQSSPGEENALVRAQILQTEHSLRDACAPAAHGHVRCMLVAPEATFNCTLDQSGCYGPVALESAYGITKQARAAGKGMTVAIVDAFGYPTAKKDLALYRQALHLPKLCASCFEVVNQTGGSKLPPASAGWDGEQALDTDMVSAICPNCRIVLVESNDDADANLFEAVATALKKADVVSNSWGIEEFATSAALFDEHPGKIMTAAAGDNGYYAGGVVQPCSFAGVVCVGGTSLFPNNSARGWTETVWSDVCVSGPCATGSGCSALVPKPAWQHDKGCTMRSETDISAVSDPTSGVVIALDGKCCYGHIGGTSAATPIIAAMFALTGDTKTAASATLWRHGGTHAFNAVIAGNNGTCPSAIEYICTAGTNMNGVYSGPTGWGTPNGLSAL